MCGMEICDGAPMRTVKDVDDFFSVGYRERRVDRGDVVSVGQQTDRRHALGDSLATSALASGIKALHC